MMPSHIGPSETWQIGGSKHSQIFQISSRLSINLSSLLYAPSLAAILRSICRERFRTPTGWQLGLESCSKWARWRSLMGRRQAADCMPDPLTNAGRGEETRDRMLLQCRFGTTYLIIQREFTKLRVPMMMVKLGRCASHQPTHLGLLSLLVCEDGINYPSSPCRQAETLDIEQVEIAERVWVVFPSIGHVSKAVRIQQRAKMQGHRIYMNMQVS